MTLAEAMQYVANRCPLSQYPAIPADTFEALVSDSARHTTHSVNTAYVVGKRIVAPVDNGRMYKCVIAGTTASTAPDFPDFDDARIGEVLKDGSCHWQDVGPMYPDRYDVYAALRACWLWKASVAASDIDATDGGLSYRSSQIQKQCLEMAKRYVGMAVE